MVGVIPGARVENPFRPTVLPRALCNNWKSMRGAPLHQIAPFGWLLIVGFTSGRAALVKTNHLLIKDAEAIGFTIGGLARLHPAWERKNFEILLGWLAAGRITPYVSHRLPLERAAEALQLIRQRKVIGKAVLV